MKVKSTHTNNDDAERTTRLEGDRVAQKFRKR